jgi:hypothetical protein
MKLSRGSSMKKLMSWILGASVLVIVGVLVITYLQFSPFQGLCEILPWCLEDDEEVETEFVDSRILWERITTRFILDVGKYERNGEWSAQRTPEIAGVETPTQSMTMNAIVNITIGVNLENVEQANIEVNDESKRVVIYLPQPQPYECFITEATYDSSCLWEQCDILERDLQEKAIQETLNNNDFLDKAMTDAAAQAENKMAEFIAPLIPSDYTLQFIFSEDAPPPIESGTCAQYQ